MHLTCVEQLSVLKHIFRVVYSVAALDRFLYMVDVEEQADQHLTWSQYPKTILSHF